MLKTFPKLKKKEQKFFSIQLGLRIKIAVLKISDSGTFWDIKLYLIDNRIPYEKIIQSGLIYRSSKSKDRTIVEPSVIKLFSS